MFSIWYLYRPALPSTHPEIITKHLANNHSEYHSNCLSINAYLCCIKAVDILAEMLYGRPRKEEKINKSKFNKTACSQRQTQERKTTNGNRLQPLWKETNATHISRPKRLAWTLATPLLDTPSVVYKENVPLSTRQRQASPQRLCAIWLNK